MAAIPLTQQQRLAVETTGCGVLVSAAAGSGKTAVLAERCAYLVCDAPPDVRCDVDQLLVMTFTDAAASEMRSRIAASLRARLAERPNDARLREQVALADHARISTIHAFCRWLIRRWFTEVEVDPHADVLSKEEADLLRREVLDELLETYYSNAQRATGEAAAAEQDALASSFVRLVDDYGLGNDREIARFVLKLDEFTSSLPEPQQWLRAAAEDAEEQWGRILPTLTLELRRELEAQAKACRDLGTEWRSGPVEGHFYATKIEEYGGQVEHWAVMLPKASTTSPMVHEAGDVRTMQESGTGNLPVMTAVGIRPCVPLQALQTAYDAVQSDIAAFAFDRKTGPRLKPEVSEAGRAARDAASEQWSKIKTVWFAERIKGRFCAFSAAQWNESLRRTVPYATTLVNVVSAFRTAYDARKRRLGVLDFADLERLAHRLLTDPADSGRPTAPAIALHRRFSYVLVDEFQDINPLQQAVIERVCRGRGPGEVNNLFLVGDVKQSIYRFRLAEPRLFTERMAQFHQAGGRDRALFLQSNFRSRPEILNAVNQIFRVLMQPDTAGITYDRHAELVAGRTMESNAATEPVELHVLDRNVSAEGENEDEDEVPPEIDHRNAALWSAHEREAYLVGTMIRTWVGTERIPSLGRPLRYRDIVVLLRAARYNAERMATMLSAQALPAYADAGGSLLDAVEVRDVLAALQSLDNVRQDLPLASVMRSGIFGIAFSIDELVILRCLDRQCSFHEVVERLLKHGDDEALRARVTELWNRILSFRQSVRRRPLAEVLWELLERHGYWAYAGSLPRGPQRLANLVKLHELARQFGTFRRQGLHRFLRFLESIQADDVAMAAASAQGESDDVVRILSIHQSKGLEFPVVFVAGLGTRFNLRDRRGRMIFERQTGIGLRSVDREKMIETPTAAHLLTGMEIERMTREEEMRILYVAMTRAKEKLVLIGSRTGLEGARRTLDGSAPRRKPAALHLQMAATPLDWLLSALGGCEGQPIQVQVHESNEIAAWKIEDTPNQGSDRCRLAMAKGEPLPEEEPIAPVSGDVDAVLRRMGMGSSPPAGRSLRASVRAGELRTLSALQEQEDRREMWAGSTRDEAALDRGIVMHRILEHLDFQIADGPPGLDRELQRMHWSQVIGEQERPLVDVAALEWFVATPLAERIRAAGPAYRREFSFMASVPASLVQKAADTPDDFVLVRGIVDGILPGEDGIEIVDFKTDNIALEEVPARSQRYRPQVQMYARAVSQMWAKPVVTSWLVFLTPRRLLTSRGENE